jgi:hypothetical protein
MVEQVRLLTASILHSNGVDLFRKSHFLFDFLVVDQSIYLDQLLLVKFFWLNHVPSH